MYYEHAKAVAYTEWPKFKPEHSAFCLFKLLRIVETFSQQLYKVFNKTYSVSAVNCFFTLSQFHEVFVRRVVTTTA